MPVSALLLVGLLAQAPLVEAPVAVSAPERVEHVAHAAIGSFLVASFADLSTTMYMSGKGGFEEANPVLRPFYDKPVTMALVKGGLATLVAYALMRLHKKHPKLVSIVGFALAAGTGYVAWRNSQLERGAR